MREVFALFPSGQRDDGSRGQQLGAGSRASAVLQPLHEPLEIDFLMRRVLVDHEEPVLVLDQPVGLEELADDPEARQVLLEQDPFVLFRGKIRVPEQAFLHGDRSVRNLKTACRSAGRREDSRARLSAAVRRRAAHSLVFEQEVFYLNAGRTPRRFRRRLRKAYAERSGGSVRPAAHSGEPRPLKRFGMRLAPELFGRFLRLLPLPLSLLRLRLEDLAVDQLRAVQDAVHALLYKAVDSLGLGETHFHLVRMDVDVRLRGRDRKVKDREREAVLHEVGAVARFERLREHGALQHPAVHEEDLEIPGAPRDLRLSYKAPQAVIPLRDIDRKDFSDDLSSVDPVEELFEVAVPGRMQFLPSVRPVVKGNVRVGKRLALDEVRDVTGFRLGLLQEPGAHGNIVEKVPHDHAGAVRSADLLEVELYRGILRKARQRLVRGPYTGQGIPGLSDHLHLGDGGDTRESFPAESQCHKLCEVAVIPDLARRVALEGLPDLAHLNAAPVIRDADHLLSAIPDLACDRCRARVDRVLDKFFDDVDRPLYDFSRRDPVDRLFAQKMNFHSA